MSSIPGSLLFLVRVTLAVTLACTVAGARAALPEPSAVYFGTIEVGGNRGLGELEARIGSDVLVQATIPESSTEPFVLQIPVVHMLAGEAPPLDAALVGDTVRLYLNDLDTGESLQVTDRGIFSNVALAISGFVTQLQGVSAGGEINIRINGIALSVDVAPGLSANSVLNNVVNAILGDSRLAGVGVTSRNGIFTTNGTVSQFDVDDPGLTGQQEPVVEDTGSLVLKIIRRLIE